MHVFFTGPSHLHDYEGFPLSTFALECYTVMNVLSVAIFLPILTMITSV